MTRTYGCQQPETQLSRSQHRDSGYFSKKTRTWIASEALKAIPGPQSPGHPTRQAVTARVSWFRSLTCRLRVRVSRRPAAGGVGGSDTVTNLNYFKTWNLNELELILGIGTVQVCQCVTFRIGGSESESLASRRAAWVSWQAWELSEAIEQLNIKLEGQNFRYCW